jgi:hypothetical protein
MVNGQTWPAFFVIPDLIRDLRVYLPFQDLYYFKLAEKPFLFDLS